MIIVITINRLTKVKDFITRRIYWTIIYNKEIIKYKKNLLPANMVINVLDRTVIFLTLRISQTTKITKIKWAYHQIRAISQYNRVIFYLEI